ncbi:MAG: alpha-ketoacid dehydrogenase subunit alpha/beta [Fimbriimonadaceae bacterium]
MIPVRKAYSKVDLLKLMLLSREGDRREGILLRQSKGWFQVSGTGHEALGALAMCLQPRDYLFPYYRDRALMLARGITNYQLALAYYAKVTSSSKGRQMPGHYSDRGLNVFSVCTPTGGSLLPACGAAWAMKLEGSDAVCLATVGDAASRQGEFYEAGAFAKQEKLPIVFVVEDNKYGISTPTEKFLAFNLDILKPESYLKVNGRRPDDVFRIGTEAVERARSGEGPTLIWADVDRLASHTSSDDHRVYRPLEEIEAMASRDPIKSFAEQLIRTGELTEKQHADWQEEIAAQVDADYLRAEKEADPGPNDATLYAFGPGVKEEVPPIATGTQTMVAAINTTFKRALESDPKIIFFGEDIEDPKGGVFGLTKGLSQNFPNQVFNSPLAEATIMGVAVGMAAYGLRPVFELQFIDFITPGWNQIVTNMSTLRWRTGGEWTCPCVVYAPYGAYLPGGSLWHSQSNESALAHLPGIRLAVPSTPQDAAGLFWTAIHGSDPTFILVPKHIFRKNVPVDVVEAVPFGKARIVAPGSDVTIVAWGNCVELVQAAAAKTSARIEIVDLRSLVPCDYATITESVAKTGRLVVVHEDTRTAGFGQTIVAEMTAYAERFNLLLSPPQLVARQDVHIGFSPILEYGALPDVDDVLAAIATVME